MKLYRFSPITSEKELHEAIEYVHQTVHRLCYETFGKFLPLSGNVGIFGHYFDEFQYLTNLRKTLTNEAVHYNGKYFELKEPIHIVARDGIPAATYEFLYIRKVDPYRPQVGDIDFVLNADEHTALKNTLSTNEFNNNVRVFERLEDNMIELWNPDYDIASYIVVGNMRSKV